MNNLDSLQQEEERLGLAPKAINGNAVAIGEESGYTNGVPNSLVKAVIQKESGGNPKAVSKSGAIGMMQLMPDTAKELGVDPWDANQNIQGGTKYLKQQFDKYQDWEKALAAYNAGSGTVDKAIALGGDWKANMAKIQNPSNYQQTKDYVDTLAKHANTPIEILRQEESRLFGTYNPTQYDQVGIPNETKGTSPQNVDWVEQGALNTKWQNMWNAFKQGMDQTKLSASFAQQDDAQEILDNYPDKKIELDAQLKTGEIDNTEYQNQLLDLQILAQEAQKNIQNSQEEIDSRNTKIKNEPVSQKYQVQNFLTQAQGSQGDVWDKVVYSYPQVIGSTASLMGQQIAATFGGQVFKSLASAGLEAFTPEPLASKIAAGIALTTAFGLIVNSRRQESNSEIGDALQQNQQKLISEWQNWHPNQEPSEEDFRKIRMQARQGKEKLFYENMALAIPDLVEALIMPGNKLGELLTGLSKPIRGLENALGSVQNINKATRIGSTIGRTYVHFLKEKGEEGFQYAAQQRQQDTALNLGLYENKGLMSSILSDAYDTMSSLNYSPIGVVRNEDGRYSHDPNFQFSEEAGGALALLSGAAISTPLSIYKDLRTYSKYTKELKGTPFDNADDKLLRLKAELLQKAFDTDTVHHLIEGLKTVSTQKDINGNPLLSQEDLQKEISNIKVAYGKYDAVNKHIDLIGGFLDSKETKLAKRVAKQDLFNAVIGLTKYKTEEEALLNNKTSLRIKSQDQATFDVRDLEYQKLFIEKSIDVLESEIEKNKDHATLYDYKKQLRILKDKLKFVKEEHSKREKVFKDSNIPIGMVEEAPLELYKINDDLIPVQTRKQLYQDKYNKLLKFKNLDEYKKHSEEVVTEIKAKKEALDNIETKANAKPEDVTPAPVTTPVNKTVQLVTPEGVFGGIKEAVVTHEAELSDGSIEYTLEDGSKVSTNEGWKEVNASENESDIEKLNSPDHFLDMHKYNLAYEQEALRRRSQKTGEPIQHILDRLGEKAFPAHAADKVLNKILGTLPQSEYKKYIKLVGTLVTPTKYGDIVSLNKKTRLRGKRKTGAHIILRVTDPENSKNVYSLSHGYNPEFYEEEDDKGNWSPINFDSISLERFKQLFTFRFEEVTNEAFERFKANWRRAKQFNDQALIYVQQNIGNKKEIILPENVFALDPRGALDFIGKDTPIGADEFPEFKNRAVIFTAAHSTNVVNGIDSETSPQGLERGHYYVEAKFPNGKIQWIRLFPATAKLTGEEATKSIEYINGVIADLKATNTSAPLDELQPHFDELLRGIDFFVQPKQTNLQVKFKIGKASNETEYTLKVVIVLEQGRGLDNPRQELSLTGSFKNLENLKAHLAGLYVISEFNGNKIQNKVGDATLRKNLPFDTETQKIENPLKQLASSTKKNIIKNWTASFLYFPENFEAKDQVSTEPIAPTEVPTSKEVDEFFNPTTIDSVVQEVSPKVADIERRRQELGLQRVLNIFPPDQSGGYRVIVKGDKYEAFLQFTGKKWDIYPKQKNGEFQASDPETGNALIINPEQGRKLAEKYLPIELVNLIEEAASIKGIDNQQKFEEGKIKEYVSLFRKEWLESQLSIEKERLEYYKSDTYPNKDSQARIIKAQEELIAKYDAELAALEQQPTSNQSKIEAKKADIERRKQALRDLMKATGDDIFMLGVEDGTFMGEALLNMNENGDVILTRYADSEEGLTKGKGKTKNLKDIAGQFGGEQIATSGIEGGAASFVNGVVGEYHIPLQELIDLIKSEDVVFAGLGNKEFVLSPHIADKYLTKINGKQINAKYDAELAALKTKAPEFTPDQEAVYKSLLANGTKEEDARRIALNEDTDSEFDKVTDQVDYTNAYTLDEAKQFVQDKFGNAFTVEDIDTLESNSKINGTRIGTVLGKVLYLTHSVSRTYTFHEAFHAVFNNLITPRLQKIYTEKIKAELNLSKSELQSRIDKLRKTSSQYSTFSNTQMEQRVYEEALSDKYADWQDRKLSTIKGFWSSLFQKIKNFINTLIGNPSIIHLFNQIDSGAFKNSNFKDSRTNEFDKIIPNTSPSQSRQIIYTIAAGVLNGENVTEENPSRILNAFNAYTARFDLKLPENIKFVQSLNNPTDNLLAMKKFYNKLLQNKDLIVSEVTRFLKSQGYREDLRDIEDFLEDNSEVNFDAMSSEYDPSIRVGAQIKRLLATTLYNDTDIFGRPVKSALPWREVYNRMLPVLSITNTHPDELMARLKAMGKYSPQISAFYNRIVQISGFDQNPNGVGTNGKNILTQLKKAFELDKILYLQAVDKGSSYDLFIENKRDLSETKVSKWTNQFLVVYEKILAGVKHKDRNLQDDLIRDLELLEKSMKGEEVKEEWKYTNLTLENKIFSVLNNLGITLEKPYLEFAFGVSKEDATNRATLNNIYIISPEDIKNIRLSLMGNKQIPAKNIMVDQKLLIGKIAEADAFFDQFAFQKTYTDAENKKRYSYGLDSLLGVQKRAFKNIFRSAKAVNEFIEKNKEYWKHNAILNRDPEFVVRLMKNFETGLAYDLRVNDRGVTSRGINMYDALMYQHALFMNQNSKEYNGINSSPMVLNQFADKSQQMWGVLPVFNYYDGKEKKYTPEAEEDIWNLFQQEYKRLQGKYGEHLLSFKKGSWIHFPMFGDTSNAEAQSILEGAKTDLNAVKDRVLTLVKANIDEEVKDHLALLIDNKLSEKISEAAKKQYTDLRGYLYNFTLNQTLVGIAINQLLVGDYGMAKNFEDYVKRISMLNSSGFSYSKNYDETDAHRVIYIKDSHEFINPESKEKITETFLNSLSPKEQAEYKEWHKINAIDAQVYSSLTSYEDDLIRQGRINDNMKEVIKKLKGEVIVDGEPVFPTLKEIKDAGIGLIPSKQVTAGYDSEGRTVLHKMAVCYITPQLCAKWDGEKFIPKEGKETLFKMMQLLENNKITHIVPESAAKLFFPKNSVNINTTDIEKDINESHIYKIANIYRRLQGENDSKETGKITASNQIENILGSEIVDQAKLDEHNKINAKMRTQVYDFVLSILVKDGDRADADVILKKFRNIIEESTPDNQMLEMLEAEGTKMKYDSNMPHLHSKFQALFLSTFKDVFRQKVPGVKFTAMSSHNYNILDPVTKQYRPLRGMQHKNGVTIPAEVVVSRKWADANGFKVGDEVILFRVPSQSYHSIGVAKVVDLLPDAYGDTIMAPSDFVWLMGMDFDVDALYSYKKSFFTTKSGRSIEYGKEHNPEEKFEGFVSDLFKNNTYFSTTYRDNLVNNPDWIRLNPTLVDDLMHEDDELYFKKVLVSPSFLPAEVQRIKDEVLVQTLNKFNLPSTPETLAASGLEAKNALTNKLFDLKYQILSSPELQDAFSQPLAEKSSESINLGKENDVTPIRLGGSPLSIVTARQAAVQSKGLVGTAVNGNSFIQFATQVGLQVSPEYALNFDGQTFNSFANTDKNQTRLKFDKASMTLGSIVDGMKKPFAKYLNYDFNTVNKVMIMYGLNIPEETIDAFFIQPSLKAITEKLNKTRRLTNPDLPYLRAKDKEEILLNALFSEISKNLTREEIKELSSNINTKDLLEALKLSQAKNYTKEYYTTQYKVLLAYEKLLQLDAKRGAVNRILSTNRSLGSDTSDFYKVLEGIATLTPTLTKPEVYLNALDKIAANPVLYQNITYVYGTLDAFKHYDLSETNFGKKIFDAFDLIFKSGVSEYEVAEIKRVITASLQLAVLRNSQDLSKLASTLISGEKSLSTQAQKYLLENPNNYFARLLTFSKSKRGYDLVQMDSRTQFTETVQDRLLDSFGRIAEKNPELAQEFFNYLTFKDNLLFRNNSFVKYIIPEMFLPLAKASQEINRILAKSKVDEAEFKSITGVNTRQLVDMTIENYIRHSINKSKLKNLDEKDLKGLDFEEGIFTISDPELNQFQDEEGNFDMPLWIKMGDTLMKKISQTEKTATYEPKTYYGDSERLPYALTPAQNEVFEKLARVVASTSEDFQETPNEMWDNEPQYSKVSEEQEGIVASEKTVRDLAARISHRIGIPVRFEADKTKDYKGKIENNTAIINLAHATLDTPIHEILGHPIIRAIKNKYKFSKFEADEDTPFGGTLKEETGLSQLYQNLLKELEYGKGAEVLDRIKRDYVYKENNPDLEIKEYFRGHSTPSQYYVTSKSLQFNSSPNFNTKEEAKQWMLENKANKYTLEEQQEEAIVELLGLMTAEKLDNVKDGKLISLLKRLLKEMKAFMKQLLGQKEVEIDKLPDNMTLGDLSDLLAYSNSKLILPGYEVTYTTPDNVKFKTYQEASNHISTLAKNVKNVDLNNIKIPKTYWVSWEELRINSGNPEDPYQVEYLNKDFMSLEDAEKFKEELENRTGRVEYLNIQIKEKNDSFEGRSFIEKNKEYEQSKEIIEEWKKVNNIQYNPEEIYSRGQEFSSVVGAYSAFDVNLMMQNLLHHIEDNEKAGGKFAISAFTKPIDKTIGHLEGGGGKIKFKIYPQSQDILWAANTDVYSGSVWDASEKVSKNKKSELLGVSYTKYPSLRNVNAVQPNLASIVDNLSHHHNELAISLNFSNFEIEVDEDVPYQTKKIISSINKILDQKRNGKLVKPEINKITTIPNTFEYWQQDMNEDGGVDRFRIQVYKKNNKWFEEFFDTSGQSESVREITYNEVEDQFNEALASNSTLTRNKGIQPTTTNETLKESIDSVKNKLDNRDNLLPTKFLTKGKSKGYSGDTWFYKENGEWYMKYVPYDAPFDTEVESYDITKMSDAGLSIDEVWESYIKENPSSPVATQKEKEYTSQALINTKIAALKEVAKKYPRSLIRSEVKPTSSQFYKNLGFEDGELPFQKLSKTAKANTANTTLLKSMTLRDDVMYSYDEINSKMLEEMGYNPIEIGKILKKIC